MPFFKRHGFDKIKESQNNHNYMAVTTNSNSVKVELKWIKKNDPKSICVLVDYQHLDPKKDRQKQILEHKERHQIMKDHFRSQGRQIKYRRDFGSNSNDEGKCFCLDFVNIEDMLLIVKDIDNLEGIAKTRRYGTQLWQTEYNPLKIAKAYIFAIENEYQDMLNNHRDLLTADTHDKRIALNRKTEEFSYREHLVPVIVVHNEAIRMAQAGDSAIAISQMIERNLKIGHIRPSEAKQLNETMQMTMPEGWQFGDSILARLDVLNIRLKTD